jgi:hypothetical protein
VSALFETQRFRPVVVAWSSRWRRRRPAVEYKSPRTTIGIPVLIHHFLGNAAECLDYPEDRLSYELNQTPKYSHKNSKREGNRVECNRNSFISVHIAPPDLVDFFDCFENACE